MMQTLMVKLNPSKEQHAALLNTMEKFNDACNFVADYAFQHRMANKIALGKVIYYPIRERFGLSAQMTIRAIAKTVEAYKRDKNIKPKFKPHGAMVYDQRILSWKGIDRVSILTLNGRIIVPIRIGEYQRVRMDRIRGQVDLIYRKGIFYLAVVVDAPEPTKFDPVGVLGVDLGIVNLAVDSDGDVYAGDKVDVIRDKTMKIKSKLQRCGSRSAKRHLKKISGKEQRFRRDVNHCISKKIVAKAKHTGRMISLEDIKGIRSQIRVRRAQRSRHHSWGFYQLRSFIEYKAVLNGVPTVLVNPRGTSHICPECGHNERRNRPSRDDFRCVQCGFAGSADHVAAINIAARADVNQPIVSGNFLLKHLVSPQGQAHEFIRG